MFDNQKFNVLCGKKQFLKAFTFLKKNEGDLNDDSLKSIFEKQGEGLIEIYFGQAVVIQKLTRFLLNDSNYKNISIENILKKKAFLHQEQFIHIKDVLSSDVLLKELTFWRDVNEAVQIELTQFDDYLRNLSLEKFIIRLVIYYEYNRFKNPRPDIDDPNILSVFNLILTRFINLKPEFGNPSHDHDVFVKKYKSELNLLLNNKSEFERLNALFVSFEKLDIYNYLLDRYIYQGYKIDFLDNGSVSLSHSDEGYIKRWFINDAKNRIRDQYYHNLLNFIFEEDETRIQLDFNLADEDAEHLIRTRRNLYQYQEHFLQDKITTKRNQRFFASDFLSVMNSLSVSGNKVWNEYMDERSVIVKGISEKIELDDAFILKFIENSSLDAPPVFALNQKECALESQRRANIENLENVKAILDWSSLDFNDQKAPSKIDLNWNPLIKYGDNYLFICGIFSNKNYADVLASKIRFEKLNTKKDSDKLEQSILSLFSQSEFATYSGNHRIGKGDFDLLAYKDNILIVAQLKGTRGRATIKEIYDDRGAINTAIEQIDKDIMEIKNDFDQLKKELNIKCSFEELIIYPIIITNNFEHEEELYRSNRFDFNISKFSILELEIVLTNSKPILTKKENDLFWNNTDVNCSGMDFIRIIDKRLLWEGVINFDPKVNVISAEFGNATIEYQMC